METDIKVEWNKLNNERLSVELQAQEDFIPASEAKYPPYHMESIIDRILIKENKKQNTNTVKKQTFIPGKVYLPKERNSCLTKREQAVSLNVLKMYQSGFDSNHITAAQQNDLTLFKEIRNKILQENKEFLNFAKQTWEKYAYKANQIKPTLQSYGSISWKKKLMRSLYYPQFYKPLKTISLAHDSCPPVEVKCIQEVACFGMVPKFSCPTLKSKCILTTQSLPLLNNKETYNSKLSVSQDNNITKFLQDHTVDVVISLSGLKRLMDDSNLNMHWDIPIVVKLHNVKLANGDFQSKKVVYIDKPLPEQAPSYINFNEVCHKLLIKTNLCQTSGLIHPNSEEVITDPNYYDNFEELCTSSLNNEATKKIKRVFNELKNCDEIDVTVKKETNKVHHNVSYSIWDIKANNEQNVLMKGNYINKNIRLLVRHKHDACERLPDDSLRPLTIVPKLEYQVQFGANIPTKTELIRQWTDLFFKPFSHLYRVHLHSKTSEVISIESVNLQKINAEAVTHYNYKPHERLNMLHTIFTSLTDVDVEIGNYILHHTSKLGTFVELMKADLNIDQHTYNLHKAFSLKNCHVRESVKKEWCPIDVNYIFPMHNVYKRMPGLFKPIPSKNISKKVCKKKRKKPRRKTATTKK